VTRSAVEYFKRRGLESGGGGAWFAPVNLYQARGNLTAEQLRDLARAGRELTMQVAGKNAPLPINYGRRDIPARIGAVGMIGGDLVVQAIHGIGLHEEIEGVYVNDELNPAGITMTHYLGTTTQGVDPTLALAVPTYNSDMVLRLPTGEEGVAYTVLRIPGGAIDNAPRIRSIVKGIRPVDPRIAATEDNQARYWRVYVDDSNTTDSFFCDIAEIELRATLGGADQASGGTASASDGTAADAFDDDSATFLRLGTGPGWVAYDFGALTVVRQVAIQAGDNAFRAERAPKDFKIQYSHDGSTWHTAAEITGETAWGISEVRTFEVAVQPTNRPYSDNTALCWGDLASNPVYGAGAPTLGVAEAADWCDTLVSGTERARIAYSFVDPQLTETYLDLLADYAQCGWYREGASLKIYADSAVSGPNGEEMVGYGDFSSAEGWTLGEGWSIGGGEAYAIDPAAEEPLERVIPAVTGEQMVVSLTITEIYTGDVALHLDGLEVIAPQTSAGTYTATITAAADNPTIKAVPSADFQGDIDEISAKGLFWRIGKWLKDSLNIDGLDDRDAPTKVYVRWTEPSLSSGTWGDAEPAEAELPGVEPGDVRLIPTTLDFPGIYRLEEAQLKADSYVQRFLNQVDVSWGTTDIGARFRPGDPIWLYNATLGVDIKLKVRAADMVDYGQHRITGRRYDPAHYPDVIEIPADAGVVPVNLIMPLQANTVPSGWVEETPANGRFIIGAGDLYASGDTGGSETHAGLSGNTESVDSHGGSPSYTTFRATTNPSGSDLFVFRYLSASPPDLTHPHTYDTGTITPDLYRRGVKLARKTGATSTTIPPECTPLGLPGLLAAGMTRVTSEAGRLLVAAAAVHNAGVASKHISFATGDFDDTHKHWSTVGGRNDFTTSDTVYQKEEGGGLHHHDNTLELNRNPKRTRVAMYSSTQEMPVLPGFIGFWDEVTYGPIPAGWVLCDGSGATHDVVNRLIEIAAEGLEGTKVGDNTISIDGYGSYVEHDHDGPSSVSSAFKVLLNHGNKIKHRHRITNSDTWQPPFFGYSVIMFSP
jgi:hypothetical protein